MYEIPLFVLNRKKERKTTEKQECCERMEGESGRERKKDYNDVALTKLPLSDFSL
jgi:hypothetical protein